MKFFPHFLVVGVLLTSTALYGQNTPPRTTPAEPQIISFDEFDKLPKEVQKIMKDNPNLYVIKEQVPKPPNTITVSATEFAQFPQTKKDYILSHPEVYKIESTSSHTNTTTQAVKSKD